MWENDTVASGGEVLISVYPRGGRVEWVYGRYNNWPPGFTLEEHQNLRANLGGLYFAGEATSSQYFGYLQGAYREGKEAGEAVARCLRGEECDGGPGTRR